MIAKNRPLISAVICVCDFDHGLEKCLKSLRNFADEIIVTDMQTTNDSRIIAQNFGAKIIPYKYLPWVEPARNFSLNKASGKWIILLDPDEYLNKSLKKELLNITRRTDVDFVKIPRKNLIFNKWLKHSNCWPDYLIRFFKKGSVVWQKEIHSQPITKGNGLTILDSEKLAIRHSNYLSIVQFVTRAIRYSNIQANELKSQNYKVKTSDLILKPIQEFNSRFFAAEGYKDGVHGLIFSILQAFAIALIYIQLWEKEGSPEKIISKESFVSASQETVFEYGYWFTKYFINEYTSNPIKILLIRFRHLLNRLTKNF